MCNCIEETAKSLREKIGSHPETANVKWVVISGGMTTPRKVIVTAFYAIDKKLKNDKTKMVEDTISIMAAFCPFCGEKYEEA